MTHETFDIKVAGSQDYARLITYIQDYREEIAIRKRPLVLVCPGGGYSYTSAREAEPMALTFLNMGCHVAILHYSCAPARYPVAMRELAKAVKLIRDYSEEWYVDPDQIILQGCSAGGHLVASYACFWQDEVLSDIADAEYLKPNGLFLCYPVITSGEHAHRGSFENLLGKENGSSGELCEKMSLENQVGPQVPPTFIWHTFEDGSVPVENSLLFASALRKAGVSTELHIFPKGGHGLGLANDLTLGRSGKELQEACQVWPNLAAAWIKEFFPLTMELEKK